jgi:site-specific recombinase
VQIVALVALAVAAVAIVAAALALDRCLRSQASERADWCEERRSLLDRIQHPEVLQAPPPPLEPPVEAPLDESAWAGTSRSVARDG